ncbi:3-oxoacyl-ACP synthase III family protein [Anaeromyxobacter oryzae]|uniref:3-oxoacyl-[acyl-carrier-protein] synthase 3 n=1 Tax=Anaeromyxobacter oryzae TaxID=2918170 RepID=A0ABM7WVJ5_9BACT|nr:beta-ketoacyl-ACP synthase III [Anaeromyxobacter oryzae]BDG03521.1 3-oxoacyl-[acyl-carrier-protein] synthase 3 [Anaeromyxobacter oryzae]
MPRAAFAAVAAHVPDRVVTNDDLTKVMETSDAWIQERTGIRERRWVREGTENSDLAYEATKKALAKAGWQPKDVEAIVYASLSPDHMFPGDGCYLNAKLGIPGVPAIDIRNQCSGFVYGLAVADAWIRIGMYRRVLLVGSEIHSTGLDVSTRGRDVAVIFGDGAGAALLEATDDPDRGVLSCHLHADGRYTAELSCEAPGSKYHPRVQARMIEDGSVYPRMEGQRVFKNAIVRMPEVLREALAKSGLEPKDLKILIPHQANLRIAQMVQRSLELRDDQVFNNIQKYGNTTAASIPIALAEAVEERGIQRGDLVGLCAFGAGFTWASALVRW